MVARERVSEGVLLDGRLALYHEKEDWLAVADVHFGYELSQRAAGWLTPIWGMESVTKRLLELLTDYQPARLIIIGDVVHDGAAASVVESLLEKIRACCEVTLVAGNHDRHIARLIAMVPFWETPGFHFHHGHCAPEPTDRIQIIGHHHPAGTISDGAGLRLKLPAFIQQNGCWIMPAFSPWAAGTSWRGDEQRQVWLCSPQRILQLNQTAASS